MSPDPAGDRRSFDRVIVGAGMSGLAHAWWAHLRGESVAVLERSAEVGGVIGTLHTAGYRHERAATSIPSSSTNLLALLESLPDAPRLQPAEAAAKKQFLLRRRGLVAVPRSPPALVSAPLMPAGSKLRIFGELLRGPRRVAESETLHQFVRRRFGLGVAEAFLRPFTNGIYGASPDRLGAADAFPRLRAMERRRGSVLKAMIAERTGAKRQVLLPSEGTASIPRAIAAALGGAVETGVRVARIEPGGRDVPARVHLEDGRSLEAGEVALATRAGAQATLVRSWAPEWADRLEAVRYVPIAVVAVGFRSDRGPPVPAGFGFLRGHDAQVRILGATFNSHLNPAVAPEGCHLVTAFVGGSEDPEAVALPDAELRPLVLRDLATAFGGAIEPDIVQIWRWPRAIPLFAPGHRRRMAQASAALAGRRIRLLGSHATGVSLNDCCAPLAPLPGPLPEGLLRV
jgi:oxygen-dependent protoporphyrinogen oxidase